MKSILFVIAGLMGLLILISVAIILFLDTGVFKSRLEKAASEALGMEVRVGGRLEIDYFPRLRMRLDDVHIRNQAMDVASAKEASVEVALLPLLRKEVRIRRVGLQRPNISMKRDRDGVFNFEKREVAQKTFLTLDLHSLSLTDGAFLYQDEQSGEDFEVRNFNLDIHGLQIAGGSRAELLKHLSITAEFTCREVRTKGLAFSDVKFTCKGKEGVFVLDPVTIRLFGGQGSGRIGMDFSGPEPRYSIRTSLSKFRIEEYLKTLSQKKVAEGAMDFSANLTLRGKTANDLKRTAAGEISLRGENLVVYGSDIDRQIARFKSSQNFNLVDAGAFFFAGPLGLAVTKGYNFASIFQGSEGSSSIGKFCSDWKVEGGIMQARDVAMATKKNRIALKGKADLVDERFDDVTLALIDARGCAIAQQKISGPFRKPVVGKPSALMSLAGPVFTLLKEARELFTGGRCEMFYTGSVPAPK